MNDQEFQVDSSAGQELTQSFSLKSRRKQERASLIYIPHRIY